MSEYVLTGVIIKHSVCLLYLNQHIRDKTSFQGLIAAYLNTPTLTPF